MRWDPADTVPRQMLELCKNVLRTCLAERVELQKQLAKTRAEIERLRRRR